MQSTQEKGLRLWRFGNTLKNTTKSAMAAYIALFLVEITVAASSLPSVYLSDERASCGARFLVYYAVGKMFFSGGMMFLLSANTVFSEAPRLKPPWLDDIRQGLHFAVAAAAVFIFFGTAFSQLTTFRVPPPAPHSMTNCEHLDDGAAH